MPLTHLSPGRRAVKWVVAALAMAVPLACSGYLDVPTSPSVSDPNALRSRSGAEAIRAGAIFQFAIGMTSFNDGQMLMAGEMSDELLNLPSGLFEEPVDQRRLPMSSPTTFYSSDEVVVSLSKAHIQAELAIAGLRQSARDAPASEVGEMFGIIGYSDLVLAEDFCDGISLSDADGNGHVTFGEPLTADSVYGAAVAAFDSALLYTADSVRIAGLAAVGKARALLGRGQYAAAASAAASVPVDFTYTVSIDQVQNDLWDPFVAGDYSMTDVEGGNGLPFISANDPRLATYVAGVSFDGVTPVIYPAKYAIRDTPISIADGIEAKLIVAEGALAAGDVSGWLDTLNVLRTTEGNVAGLAPLADPGSAQSRVDTLFTERAFWMFGTGHRMGDLRRLVRQYGRNQATVFPVGPYAGFGGGTYGNDVNFPIPNSERSNPNYKGCLNRNA